MSKFRVMSIPFVLLFALSLSEPTRAAQDLSNATPESVGFSSEQLKRLDAMMQNLVDQREYAGIVTLVARHGKVIHFSAVGKQDLANSTPVSTNTIFRIFSMTKPVTAVAMMMLYEDGKWSPQDPISKFIPEFAGLKVYKGADGIGRPMLEDPTHQPTMRELMTMTAGFSYGGNETAVDQLYQDDQGRSIFLSGSLQAMMGRLAKVPLLYQPSSRWKYSLSADIQGYIIEKLSGMTLPEFMRKQIFGPLRMKDTDFYVPKEKRDRFSILYEMSAKGYLQSVPDNEIPWFGNYAVEPALPMGGGGLVSTAADYFRFAQMLLNGGELDGIRILSPQTVKLMTSNHLADDLMKGFKGGGNMFNQPRAGLGYGYDGAVVTDPGQADVPIGKGSYFWDGAAGTWFWIDPTNDIVVVGMVQRIGWWERDGVNGAPPFVEQLCMATTYQALLNPER
jgi:CubicO group peptidase (beta-lactamase class C family)